MAKVKITVRANGPYRVEDPEGLIELVDAAGTAYDLTGKPVYAVQPGTCFTFQTGQLVYSLVVIG